MNLFIFLPFIAFLPIIIALNGTIFEGGHFPVEQCCAYPVGREFRMSKPTADEFQCKENLLVQCYDETRSSWQVQVVGMRMNTSGFDKVAGGHGLATGILACNTTSGLWYLSWKPTGVEYATFRCAIQYVRNGPWILKGYFPPT